MGPVSVTLLVACGTQWKVTGAPVAVTCWLSMLRTALGMLSALSGVSVKLSDAWVPEGKSAAEMVAARLRKVRKPWPSFTDEPGMGEKLVPFCWTMDFNELL